MAQVIQFDLDDGGTVLVEPAGEAGVVRIANAGATIRGAASTYEAALEGVRHAAEATLRQFTSLARQPDEVTVEFGVRLDLAAGAVIARTAVEGHLQVTLTWKRPEPHADTAVGAATAAAAAATDAAAAVTGKPATGPQASAVQE